jgi:tetratricopeptide (TPR) repeat protein
VKKKFCLRPNECLAWPGLALLLLLACPGLSQGEEPATPGTADEPSGETAISSDSEDSSAAGPQPSAATTSTDDDQDLAGEPVIDIAADEDLEDGPPSNFTGPALDDDSEGALDSAPEDELVAPRVAAFQRMSELMQEGRYEEAAKAARRALTLSEQEFGADDIRLVAALNNFATTLMLSNDLIGAENIYQRSLALVERLEGILSPRLINTFIGLGATYNRAKLYEQGTEAFERALRINHVNEGFYNFEQFKIRDGLTEANIGLEELEEANFQQEIQVEIQKRKLGEDNPEIATAMYKLGRWYERSGQVELARQVYQEARRLLYSNYGKDDIVLVDALVGIASTYARQGLMAESANALKRALTIIENQPERDYLRSAELLIALGDLYNRYGKSNSSKANYESAWQALSVDESYAVQRDEYFLEPMRIGGLSFATLRFGPGVREDSELLRDGYVLLGYTISAAGRAEDLRVIEAEPAELMDKKVARVMERSYFRPRISEGVVVDTTDQLYRHDFRYLPEGESRPDSEDVELSYPGGRLERPGEDGEDE